MRRAWAALTSPGWSSDALIQRWAQQVAQAGRWQAHRHGGYQPVAVDLTGFWRPRLRGCPTTHYHAEAGKALPAIPHGLITRIGSLAGQRVGLLLGLVRADPADPSPRTHAARLVAAAVDRCAPADVLVVDGGFGVALLQAAGATAFVARVAKNVTARRATPAPYGGRGRRPTRGTLVRPLPRRYGSRFLPATPPDQRTTWTDDDGTPIQAEVWSDLVLPDAAPGSPTFRIIAIHDARFRTPLLLATSLALSPRLAHALYHDRWPVEQVPLTAKQLLGAVRQFVHAPEACQRLPELALIAGAILNYLAAALPAAPTGFWDRRPRPTAGRLRRTLARLPFPHDFALPVRVFTKNSVTEHLPKGWFGQRRPRPAPLTPPSPARTAPAESRVTQRKLK